MADDQVLDAILETAGGATAEETPARSSPVRDAQGRFAAPQEGEEPEEAVAEPEAEDAVLEAPEGEEEASEEEQPEEQTNIDDYLVPDVVVDGQPVQVTLRELKQNYSGNQYIAARVQKAVEHDQQRYQALGRAVERLEAIEGVWRQFAEPQVDWNALKANDPIAYAQKRVVYMENQERLQQIQQEIRKQREEQASIDAEARQRRMSEGAHKLLQVLPGLADPQKLNNFRREISEVAQSHGIAPEILDTLDDPAPLLVLAENAVLRRRVAELEKLEERINRPTGDTSRPKVLVRPGPSQPAASSSKKLEAQHLERARRTGKPDDVAATLIVSRRKA